MDKNKIESKKSACIPFWSWNDKLEPERLIEQIDWMYEKGVGGFFMHARAGLKTEYLSDEWMQMVKLCADEAEKRGIDAWMYDENGWPSGYVGGKLLNDKDNRDCFLLPKFGDFEPNCFVSYKIENDKLKRVSNGKEGKYLNIMLGISSSTVDILNPDITDKFIKETHEKYKKYFGDAFASKIKGFFTDEPQYYRWNTPYTPMLEQYFKEKYHLDILDCLGLLFFKGNGYKTFRYRYWCAMQHLMLDNYAARVYDWCDNNGVCLTGHYIEETSLGYQLMCCGGVMPFYEYEHIPGIDRLGKSPENELAAKQLGSAAAQLGKKQRISEMFACTGWDVTPYELKKIAERQYVCGVNLMCQHLLPYSEIGNRKYDHPSHFSAANPWVSEYFLEFNNYFTNLGDFLSESEELVNVAVLHPMRSAYFEYQREDEANGFGIAELDKKFAEQLNFLCSANIPFHFLDETLLEKHGFVDETFIGCGCCKYDILVLPICYSLSQNTWTLIKQYLQNGGKLLMLDAKPEFLEGEKYDFTELKSNISFEEILKKQFYRFSDTSTPIRSTLRKNDNGYFLYVVNTSDEYVEIDVFVKGFNSFEKIDIITKKTTVIPLSIQLKSGESSVLCFSNKPFSKTNEKQTISVNGEWVLDKSVDNNYTMDTVYYSFDSNEYYGPINCDVLFSKLLKMRYSGKLYLKYCFTTKILPKKAKLITEYGDLIKTTVNGNTVEFTQMDDFKFHCADISKLIQLGMNEVLLEYDFYQREYVYRVMFDDENAQSLQNSLTYDVEISPVYLCGDFGVFSQNIFEKNKIRNQCLEGKDFYIDNQKGTVSELVTEGFPFFSGKLTISKWVYLSDTAVNLQFSDAFQCIKAVINGKKLLVSLFENIIDVSNVAKIGENKITLEAMISNHNKMGPHHCCDPYPEWVGPTAFQPDFGGKDFSNIYYFAEKKL